MTPLIELATNWRLLLVAVVVVALAPGVILRAVVRLYPKGHPRREELVAELYSITMAMRPFWVVQQFETALFEGIPARLHARRARHSSREEPEVTVDSDAATGQATEHRERITGRVSDAELVHLVRLGDTDAWDALVDRFGSRVWAMARAHRLPPADAEEVFHRTWMRLVTHIDSIREPDEVARWLSSTARHESLLVRRRDRGDGLIKRL